MDDPVYPHIRTLELNDGEPSQFASSVLPVCLLMMIFCHVYVHSWCSITGGGGEGEGSSVCSECITGHCTQCTASLIFPTL